MNDWYTLTNDLETKLGPLDEVSQKRIKTRVCAAIPHRKKRPQLIAAIAALLVLTACGYAAATGQFSQWFWSVSDLQEPESDEDLLASMGTVIDQSQTVNGDTVTLHGAIWDGKTLMLSATIDSASIPTDSWTNVESHDSRLHASRESMMQIFLEYYPDTDEAELERNIDEILESMKAHNRPEINYMRNRNTGAYYLQIEDQNIVSNSDSIELELHLENIKFRNSDTIIEGPFDFTFTVEQRYPEVVYEGSLILEQESGIDLHITKVTLTPFNAEVTFDVPGTMSKEVFDSDWLVTSLNTLRLREETVGFSSSGGYTGMYEEPGIMSGVLQRGPFHRIIDPAEVDAIGLNDFWLQLDSFTLVEKTAQ